MPKRARIVEIPGTNDRQPQQRGRQAWPCHPTLPAPGRCALSAFWLLPELLPSVRSAPRLTEPSRANGDTSVVSIASCAPPCKERPSATTSNLLLSTPVVRQEVQVPDHHVGAHPGSCLSADPRSCTLEWETPPPKNPRSCTCRPGGGQRRREDGHTGKHEQTGGGEGGDGAREAPGRAGNQTASTDWLGKR